MTTITVKRELLLQALAHVRWQSFGECRTVDWDGPPPTAAKVAAALTAALAAAPTPQASTVTPAMVDAYLRANDAYWQRTDKVPTPPDKWRTGTPKEATAEGLRAALAVMSAPTPQAGEADALDAARYRFLRQEHERVNPVCHVVWKQDMDRNSGKWVNAANLDAAVDAAMKEQK